MFAVAKVLSMNEHEEKPYCILGIPRTIAQDRSADWNCYCIICRWKASALGLQIVGQRSVGKGCNAGFHAVYSSIHTSIHPYIHTSILQIVYTIRIVLCISFWDTNAIYAYMYMNSLCIYTSTSRDEHA